MKKNLLSVVLLLIFSITANSAVQYSLRESFEGSALPEGWTQEYVSGQQDWVVEQGADLLYPKGAAEGAGRVAIRSVSDHSVNYTTKLVTPVMNVKDLYLPMLVFSHAQQQWTGDVDVLTIYYRTGENREWVPLDSFVTKIPNWKEDTVMLVAPNETYQLAFEARSNMGRGIVLDNVRVRATSVCDTPENFQVDGLTTTSATIRWQGPLDANLFEILINGSEIENLAAIDEDNLIKRAFVDPTESGMVFSTGDILSRNTPYYVYIRSICEGGETSGWLAGQFRTTNTAPIPYSISFNRDYVNGTIYHADYWTHGTSITKDNGEMEFMPFVNSNTDVSSRGNYSYNKTSCLVFSGARNVSTAIPAGQYVWGATPELVVDNVKNLQVTFWGTAYEYVNADKFASGLIVGVMTDPADWSTFTAVDTVYATVSKGFDRYTVYLDKYNGNGKYVAFASNFIEKDNIFYLDEVEIKESPALHAISKVEVSDAQAGSVVVNAQMNGNTKFNVIVARDSADAAGIPILDPSTLPADYIVTNVQKNASDLPCQIDVPQNGGFVQIYLQPTDGTNKGDYTLPVKQLMPMWQATDEATYGFEADEKSWEFRAMYNFATPITATYNYPYSLITWYTTLPYYPDKDNYEYPVRYGVSPFTGTSYTNYHSGKGYLSLKKSQRTMGDGTVGRPNGQYAAFPKVENLAEYIMKFYIKSYSKTMGNSRVAAGVMSDPFDYKTFDTLAIFDGVQEYYSKSIEFSDYVAKGGKGRYPAIMAVDADVKISGGSGSGGSIIGGSYKDTTLSQTYIDDVTIRKIGGCMEPANVNLAITDTSLVITWKVLGTASKWVLNVYTDAKATNLLATQTITGEPKAEIKGLSPHTTYYYTLVVECDGVLSEAEIHEFTTNCVEAEAIPFVDSFEGYITGSSNPASLPPCYAINQLRYSYESSTSYYPYVYASSSYAHKGNNSLYFGYTSSLSTSKDLYMILPPMADDLNKLQMSIYVRPSSTTYGGDTLWVGVVADQSGLASFDTIAPLVVPSVAAYEERVISFASYAGQNKHIAIVQPKKLKGHIYYIDDIKVSYLSNCGVKVQNVTCKVSDDDVVISWTPQAVDGYEYIISKTSVEDMEELSESDIIVRRQTTTALGDTVTNAQGGFDSNTTYYVYVRTYCSATNIGEWSNVTSFKTNCLPQTPEAFGVETFDSAERFSCWTADINKLIGNPSLTTPRNTNGYLYLYNAKQTATSAGETYAILPTLNVDSIKDVEVSFDFHGGTSGSSRLEVGVSGDDFSSYMSLKSLHGGMVALTTAAGNFGFAEGQRVTVRLDNYIGDADGNFGKRITLLGKGNADSVNYVYIDNLSVRYIDALRCPLYVTIPDSTIEVGSAVVNWDAQDGAVSYEIKYADAAINPDTDEAKDSTVTTVNVKTVASATTSVTLTELPGLTYFYVYVRTVNAGGEKSIWSNCRVFRSSCPSAWDLPYSEDFDKYNSGAANLPDCWDRYWSNNTTTYPYVYSSAKNGTTGNGLYAASTIKNGPTYAILPKMNIDSVNKLMITLDYKSNAKTATQSSSGGPNRYLAIGVANNIETQEALEASVVWVDTIISSDNTNFATYTGAFNNYTGNGEYIILCSYGGCDANSTTSTTVGGVYVDNLIIERIPTCFPASVDFVGSSSSSLTVDITDNFSQTAWDLAFVPAGGDVASVTPVTVNATDTIKGGYFLIEGLPHSTQYDVYIRANCGGGDVSKWSKPVSMSTNYKVLPDKAFWDFEYTEDERANYLVMSPKATSRSYLTDPMFIEGNPNSAATYSYYPYLYPTSVPTSATAAIYGYKSDFSMRLYSTSSYPTQWFALPEIDANLDTLQIRFDATSAYISNRSTKAITNTYAKGTYPHAMKIGVMSDPNDFSTFTQLSEFVFPEVTATNDTLIGDSMAFWNHYTLNLFGAEAKGKYIAFVTDYNTTSYAYIDNIKVEPAQGCGAPAGLSVVDSTLTDASADVVWVSNKLKWNLQLYEGDNDTVAILDTIITVPALTYETKLHIDNLEGNTSYTIKVQTICGDEETSEWSVYTFKTPCTPMNDAEAEVEIDFNENLYAAGSSTTYVLPTCWELNTGGTYSATYQTYAIPGTTTYNYGRGEETTDRALRFYTTTSYYDNYVVLPETEFALDTMMLHFWGRAVYCYQMTYSTVASRGRVYSANGNYLKKLVIGIMTDPDDFSTFVPKDTITYDITLATTDYMQDDPEGENYWREYTIPLKKYTEGGRLVILAPKPTATSYFFVDDLSVINENYCFPPSNVLVRESTSNSVIIEWKGNKQAEVQVSTTADFADGTVVADKVVDAQQATIDGLQDGTTYYARVRHVCSSDEVSRWVNSSSFNTTYALRFFENFNAAKTYPKDWSRYNKRMMIVCDSTKNMIGSEIAESTSGWQRLPSNVGMDAGHLYSNIYGTGCYKWIVTPQIDLTNVTADDNVALTFKMTVTDGVAHAGDPADMITGEDDAFVIAISTDNKATWKSEDLTVWANRPFAAHYNAQTKDTVFVDPDYVYNELPVVYGGKLIKVDLSKYAGQTINIAFYGESTVKNADNDLHIDDVQVNTYTLNEYEATTCRWCDYEDEYFTLDADELIYDTTTVYEAYTPSTEFGKDHLNRMYLTVNPDSWNVMDSVVICEGDDYTLDNFNLHNVSKSGVFKQKLSNAYTCDSIVVLNLTVNPKLYTDTFKTICQGVYEEFNGVKYYETGNYVDTIPSVVTGCDSIVTLHLTVTEALQDESTLFLCEGTSLELNDTTITTGGTYVFKLSNEFGCDSIVTYEVVEKQKEETFFRAAICSGETYSVDPFRGLSVEGDYPITLLTQYGCDSLVTLHLLVAKDGTMEDSIKLEELPYVLNGQEIFGTDTPEGVITTTVNLGCGDVTLILTVGTPTALNNVYVNNLALAPNPVHVGENVQVLSHFTKAQMQQMVVEVYNGTGALVNRTMPKATPVVIESLPAAGVYMVRITTGDDTYQSKLIVK